MSNPLRFCYPKKTRVPHGGWWVHWEGEVVKGGDWSDLVAKCSKLTISKNKVPPPDLSQQIEDALCRRMAGNELCKPCTQMQQSISFNSIVRWVWAMYDFATKNKFQLVAEEEAAKRAEICASCPNQVPTSGCWGCKGIAGMLPAIAGARKTSYDPQLKACGICGCFNAVSVHLPVNIQGGDDLQFPDWCWKNQKPQSE